nr:ATP-binding cassette domain-containing protein [bacterium]
MIQCENLVKIYKTADLEVVALQGLDMTVDAGEMMAIIGNSGSGKSTLLNMLGALDKPSAGKLIVDDKDLSKLTPKEIVAYKRNTVGFVWQNNARNLIPYLTARENIEVPLQIAGNKEAGRARELLDMVGLSHRANNKLAQLSGGEQQRVAIALALANRPKVLLADEPTGAVDTKTAMMIMDVMREINRESGVTIVIVTHDRMLASKVDRVVSIRDGRTSSEFIRNKSYAEEMREIQLGLRELNDVDDIKQEEFVVVDNVGRMQLPKEALEHLKLHGKSRVRVEYETNRVVLYPEKMPDDETA